MTMQVIHQLRQVIFAKVVGTQTRIESRQAKVNRIGTGHHRCPRAIPVARRRQELGSLIMRRFAVHAPIEPASRQMTSRRRQANDHNPRNFSCLSWFHPRDPPSGKFMDDRRGRPFAQSRGLRWLPRCDQGLPRTRPQGRCRFATLRAGGPGGFPHSRMGTAGTGACRTQGASRKHATNENGHPRPAARKGRRNKARTFQGEADAQPATRHRSPIMVV